MATYYSGWAKANNPDIKIRMKIVTSISQNSNNNTSTITAKQYIESAGYVDYFGDGSPTGYSSNHKLVFAGSTYNVSTEYSYKGNTRLIQTRTKTITHNANGEGTFNLGGSCHADVLDDGGFGVEKTISISTRTISLPKINRSSTITSDATSTTKFGDTITFTINRKSANYTHTITYSMYDAAGTIATKTTSANPTWVIPTSLISSTPNNANPIITIVCETFNGNTSLGKTTYTFNCLVPTSYVPRCTLAIEEANPIMTSLNLGIYVQNLSQLKGTITATGSNGSSIISYLTTANDLAYSTNPFTTDLIKYNGEREITATVTDSRGRNASNTQTITLVEYFQPTIVSCKVERCLSDGTLNEEGTYGKATITYKVAPVNNGSINLNTVTLKATYGTTIQSITTDAFNQTYIFTQLFSGLETNSSYNFVFEVTDRFSSQSQPYTLTPSFVTISKLAGGKGVTFGQIANEEGLISYMNTKLYKNNWVNNMSVNGLKTEKYSDGSWITYGED